MLAAGVRLEVGGAVEAVEGVLEVRVDVTNRGDAAAATLDVRAEMGEETDVRTVDGGVPAGATRSVPFRFDPPARYGVHLLGLRLDYTDAPAPGKPAPAGTSQRAFLLLSVGANPPPAVRVSAEEATVETAGTVRVRVESADGAAHRARVRVLTPRGLNANTPVEVAVPSSGAASADVPILRGSVPRPSRQGVVAVAETLDGDLAHAAVATTLVHVGPDPALMPRLRKPLAALAVLLLLAAAFIEWRSRRASVPATASD